MMWMFCLHCVFPSHACLIPAEVKRRHCIPWMLYKVVYNIVGPGIEPGSSGRSTTELSFSSPVPYLLIQVLHQINPANSYLENMINTEKYL